MMENVERATRLTFWLYGLLVGFAGSLSGLLILLPVYYWLKG